MATKEKCSAAILELFAKDVYPEITKQYRDTVQSLNSSEQRKDLNHQLRETLVTTTKLVLQNNREEHCLKSTTVNSMTHTYPLLLREVTFIYKAAMKKMNSISPLSKCWNKDFRFSCCTRVNISVSFPPSLWNAFTELLKEFNAVCDCDAKPSACSSRAPASYRNEIDASRNGLCSSTPFCSPKTCSFSSYTVDVISFFRHVNETQKFLTRKPFWKDFSKAESTYNFVRGHTELNVTAHQQFQLTYNSTTGVLNLTFGVSPIRECTVAPLSPRCRHVHPGDTVGTLACWYSSIVKSLTASNRSCLKQMRRANRVRDFGPRQSRRKRTVLAFDNSIPDAPDRCTFVKRSLAGPSDILWQRVVELAKEYGAEPYGESRRGGVKFYSLGELLFFFNYDLCPETRKGSFASHFKRRGTTASVTVSSQLPFIIERREHRRLRMRYFFEPKPIRTL